MEEAVKETIIIVHGTWASPGADGDTWYYPTDSCSTAGFTSKLDAALQERGSKARCWAHCRTGDIPFFYWSGDNSWIERSRAADQLERYVAKLSKDGWLCHIVAHSHGGNVVAEALPRIIAGLTPNLPLCRIVTLGTPFMDVITPALNKDKQWREGFLNFAIMFFGFWVVPAARNLGDLLQRPTFAHAVAAFFLLILLVSIVSRWREERIGQVTFEQYFRMCWRYVAFEVPFWLSAGILVWFTIHPPYNGGKIGAGFAILLFVIATRAWIRAYYYRGKQRAQNVLEPALAHPRVLAISSRMDEAWQVLHHLRISTNPIAVRSSLLRYLTSAFRSSLAQRAAADRLQYGSIENGYAIIFLYLWLLGAAYESFDGIKNTLPEKISLYGYSVLWIVVGQPILAFTLFVLFLGGLAEKGRIFLAGFLYPFRWCRRIVGSLTDVFVAMGTYVVRARSWPVFLKLAMGLDGYRFGVPLIEQCPRNINANCLKYEDLATKAEERALQSRREWIAHNVDDVSQMFSKLSISPADIQTLLHTIESDQTLVHAAYYTDDHCIARIADWLAAEGDPMHRLS